ncbi:MAG TPA: ion channel [Polyangiaceae bacterium]|nr:ion channel [Polyangiaceae bacterium]
MAKGGGPRGLPRQRAPGASYAIRVRNARPAGLRDVYYAFLRVRWSIAVAALAAAYLALNAAFALAFLAVGGVAHARAGSFADAFFFSVQTMGTIGYGAMYPETPAANALVVVESVAGLVATALATGLVFAKFSRTTSRVVFSTRAAIAPVEGVPTLAFRVGNERGNQICETRVHVTLVRTRRIEGGQTFYRMVDLALARDRSPGLQRSWTVLHPITESSPLHGETPESLAACDAELWVSLAGTDDTTLQPVHAQYTYESASVVWGARLADIMQETPDGDLVLDVGRFDELVPSEPTRAFPYPKPAP